MPPRIVHNTIPDWLTPEFFWSRVGNGPMCKVLGSICWNWKGALNSEGYGVIGRKIEGKNIFMRAHRIAYEFHIGKIPEGLTIDHLCRNHSCVNPKHLDAVTNRENILRGEAPSAKQARQTHCIKGHPLSGSNLVVYTYSSGSKRVCRICKEAKSAARGPNRRRTLCKRCGKLKEGGIRGLRLCNSCRGVAV